MRKTERTPYSSSLAEEEQARFRSRVESFASRLTLPLSQHALGLLEGEHQSDMSGNGFDFLVSLTNDNFYNYYNFQTLFLI